MGFHGSHSSKINVKNYLLDFFPGAYAAYSLRLLTKKYRGKCIRIRRSSGGEIDIGFKNGFIDQYSIIDFVRNDSAYVTKWYDQSGNGYHLAQTNTSNQPRIVSSGVIDRIIFSSFIDFLPSIYFDGSASYMDNASITTGNNKSIYITNRFHTNLAREVVVFDSVVTNQAILYKNPTTNYWAVAFGTNQTSTTPDETTRRILSVFHNGSSSYMYRNDGIVLNNVNLGTNAFNGFRLGAARGAASLFGPMHLQEVIIYPFNNINVRTEIISNIKNTFKVVY